MFLAAASQRTKQIRLAHGIMQLTTSPPARVAERVATRMGIRLGWSEARLRQEVAQFQAEVALSRQFR